MAREPKYAQYQLPGGEQYRGAADAALGGLGQRLASLTIERGPVFALATGATAAAGGPLMDYQGFIGATDPLTARTVNAERTINWYPEIATGTPKARSWLAPTPGLAAVRHARRQPRARALRRRGPLLRRRRRDSSRSSRAAAFDARGTVGDGRQRGDHQQQRQRRASALHRQQRRRLHLRPRRPTRFTADHRRRLPAPCAMGAFIDGYFLALKAREQPVPDLRARGRPGLGPARRRAGQPDDRHRARAGAGASRGVAARHAR